MRARRSVGVVHGPTSKRLEAIASARHFGTRAKAVFRRMRQTHECGAYLYILRCADNSYYVGTTRKSLDERIGEHNAGIYGGYTTTRRPVTVVFAQHFDTVTDAIAAERQIKGWSRAKKEALIGGDWNRLPELAKRRRPHSSGRSSSADSPG
jgi:putative endonuclease